MPNQRFVTIAGMVLLAAFSRLIPHPWNVTPVAAMAFFAGVQFDRKSHAFVVPLFSLFISDLFLGFHRTMPFVYGSFALTVAIGIFIKKNRSVVSTLGGCLASSLIFFLVTNAGYWGLTPAFDKSITGLIQCYSAAIPFFRNTVLGDAFFTALMFGSFAWAEKRIPALKGLSFQ